MHPSRSVLYRDFLDVILNESTRQRSVEQRRMANVFLWCFVAPAVLLVTVVLLANFRVIPRKFRLYSDWIVLIFPVSYAIYFLGSEVISQLPRVFKQGGVSLTLNHCQDQNLWREQVCSALTKRAPAASAEDWKWIATAFQSDVEALQYRARYLTALSGSVFFLIMQGIDSMSGDSKLSHLNEGAGSNLFLPPEWAIYSNLGQFVGLGLFLVLLYLSSSQNVQQLKRFRGCLELLALKGNT